MMWQTTLRIGIAIAVGLSPLMVPVRADAQVGLSWARVEALRNQVQLLPQNGSARAARVSDTLQVGDALSTAASARAELRFNDGSLARVGERATFRFSPNTRNFQLSNGTVLLLIPPGRGRTTVQTPNTTTGIQGSGLFVRYDAETETTVVGALTENPNGLMQVLNQDGTQQQALHAGEMAVIQGNQIVGLFRFDLNTFYQTSSLAEGLELTQVPSETDLSDPVAAVRYETTDALGRQVAVLPETSLTNPAFIQLSVAGSLDNFSPIGEFGNLANLGFGSSAPSSLLPFALPGTSIGSSIASAVSGGGGGSSGGSGGGGSSFIPPGLIGNPGLTRLPPGIAKKQN